MKSRSLDGLSVPVALAGALLASCLFAAFAHGAVAAGDEERLQLGIAGIAALAAAGWLWTGTLTFRAARLTRIALGLLAGFALWSGVSLAWSVAPDQTWIECNRVVTYVIVLLLAVALGASRPSSPRLIAHGFAVVALLVTAYALGQKLAPGIRIAGVLDLDRTGDLPRLQDPLGYWNALGVFVAMGVISVLSVALDTACRRGLRLTAAASIVPMLVTIGFTYSRGAVLALAIGLAVFATVARSRLRVALWLAICVAAAVPVTVVALSSAPLTAAGASLGARERAGAELFVVLVACMTLLVSVGRRAIGLERRARLSAARRRAIARGLSAGVGAVVVVALIVVAFSARGLGGSASHAWRSFTATRPAGVYDPGRLLSADSENRWVWWKEAVGAFSDRPLGGWGAGSFGVVHLLYRRDTLSVQQPHSVPLQFLAETGLVGAVLALGALALLLAAATRAVRRSGERSRMVSAALLGAAAAYAVHGLYDWDWDIPAVTIPALLFLGTIAGASAAGSPLAALTSSDVRVSSRRSLIRRAASGALAALCLTAFAISAVVPRLAAQRADNALVAASAGGRQTQRAALASALSSSRLDPLSDAGLRAAATVALRGGDPRLARRYLARAIARQPVDGRNWQQLSLVYLVLQRDGDALAAARRSLALDPMGVVPATVVQHTELAQAPPAASATATGTPETSGR